MEKSWKNPGRGTGKTLEKGLETPRKRGWKRSWKRAGKSLESGRRRGWKIPGKLLEKPWKSPGIGNLSLLPEGTESCWNSQGSSSWENFRRKIPAHSRAQHRKRRKKKSLKIPGKAWIPKEGFKEFSKCDSRNGNEVGFEEKFPNKIPMKIPAKFQ